MKTISLDSIRVSDGQRFATSVARARRRREGDGHADAIETWIERGLRVVTLMHKGVGPLSPRGRSVAQAARLLRWTEATAARAFAMYEAEAAGLFVDSPEGEPMGLVACEVACGIRDFEGVVSALGEGLLAEETYMVEVGESVHQERTEGGPPCM